MSIEMKIPSGSERNATHQSVDESYTNRARSNIFKTGLAPKQIVEDAPVAPELELSSTLVEGFESSRNHFTGSKVLNAPEAKPHSGRRNSIFSDDYSIDGELYEGVKWDSDENGSHTLKRKYDANGNVVKDKTTPVVAHEYHNKDWGVKHGILHIDQKTGQAVKGGTPYHYEAEDQADVVSHIKNAFGSKTESVLVAERADREDDEGYAQSKDEDEAWNKKNCPPLQKPRVPQRKPADLWKKKAGMDEGFVDPIAAKKAKDEEEARRIAKDLQDEGGMPSARLGKNDAQYKVKPVAKGVLVKGRGYGDNVAVTPEKGDAKAIGEPFSFAALSKAFGVNAVTHATPGGRRKITGKDTVDDSNDGADYDSENQHKDAEAAHAPGTNQAPPEAHSPDMADKIHARLHGATRNTLAVEFIRRALDKGMQPMSILAMANTAAGRRNLRGLKEAVDFSIQMFSEGDIFKYEVSNEGVVLAEGHGYSLTSAAKSALRACSLAEEELALKDEQGLRIKAAIKQITAQ